jgi:predicted transcriptional regulator
VATGRKRFTPTEREKVIERVAELDRQGWTGYAIAEEVGVSRPMVSIYLKRIRQRYLAEQVGHRAEQVAEKCAQYKEVRRRAWECFWKSWEDKDKTVEEEALRKAAEDAANGEYHSSMMLVKRVTSKEGRLPASEYLNVVINTLKAERELLGLDEAAEVNVRVGALDWDALLKGMAAVEDPLEAEVRRLGEEVERARREGRVIDVTETGDAEDERLIEEGPEEGEGAEGGGGSPAGAF